MHTFKRRVKGHSQIVILGGQVLDLSCHVDLLHKLIKLLEVRVVLVRFLLAKGHDPVLLQIMLIRLAPDRLLEVPKLFRSLLHQEVPLVAQGNLRLFVQVLLKQPVTNSTLQCVIKQESPQFFR